MPSIAYPTAAKAISFFNAYHSRSIGLYRRPIDSDACHDDHLNSQARVLNSYSSAGMVALSVSTIERTNQCTEHLLILNVELLMGVEW